MIRPHVDTAKVKSGKLFPFVFDKSEVEANWELVEPLLARSVEISMGTVTIGGLKKRLLENKACMMGTKKGDEIQCVLVAEMVDYDTYRAARVLALAGRGFKEMFQFRHVLEVWATSQDAVEIEGWCQPSMVRLHKKYGGRPKFTMISYDLRRKLQ